MESASKLPKHNAMEYSCWCRAHVHVCAVRDNTIVLDLRRDKYFAVTGKAARALALAVPGWPEPIPSHGERPPNLSETEITRIIQLYIERGILTANSGEGRPAEPVRYLPARDLRPLGFDPEAARDISVTDIQNFLGASIRAYWQRRTSTFHDITQHVARRKSRVVSRCAFDRTTADELSSVFRRLQAFVFTGRNHCLIQSLIFANFLSLYGLFPDWVFGVQARPFLAHCWLQHGPYLLNETPERVKTFTPIFSI